MNPPSRLLFSFGLLAIPLASFLTFLAQPLTGKALVPVYGGQAVVWLSVMLFFQIALLVGYVFAGCLEPIRLKGQVFVVILLALLSLAFLEMPPQIEPSIFSYFDLFGSLSVKILPAILLTTSLSIVMHGWVRTQGGRIPYYLYSISNIGSLVALGAYPIFLEPAFGLSQLSRLWTFLFWILIFFILASAFGLLILNRENAEASPASLSEQPEIVSRIAKVGWWVLPILSTALMMIVTQELTHKLGASPISWVPPFFIFLLVYTVVFTGRISRRLTGWFWSFGFLAYSVYYLEPNWILHFLPDRIFFLLAAQMFFTPALIQMLYQLRPLKRYGYFYISSAFGGVIGGVLCAIIFPVFYPKELEIHILVIFLLILLGVSLMKESRKPLPLLFYAAGALILGVPLSKEFAKGFDFHYRSIYGTFEVQLDNHRVNLVHGKIVHGSQFLVPEKSLTPTTYYTESSSLGKLIPMLQSEKRAIHIGVIGLGAGTLAAYLRPEDKITFWEIDPLSERIAREVFTFLDQTSGDVDVIIKDGRLGLDSFSGELDLLVVDAFSGDGIPPHLLTKEALSIYASKSQNSLVVLHTTSEYLHVARAAMGTIEALGYTMLGVHSHPSFEIHQEMYAAPSTYVIFAEESRASLLDELKFRLEADDMQREAFAEEASDPTLVWTDDHHAIWPIIKWKKLL